MQRGYTRDLYIQPFDHRGSFQTNMFGWKGALSEAQTAEIAATKRVIYDGFLAAIAGGAPKDKAGVLVDEQFGAAILRDAKAAGFAIACAAEKSGREEERRQEEKRGGEKGIAERYSGRAIGPASSTAAPS